MSTAYIRGIPVPLGGASNVEDYDEGNWHIRKWSNGYLEMFLERTRTISSSDWAKVSGVDSLVFIDPLFTGDLANPAFPIPLVALYETTHSVLSAMTSNGTRSGFFMMTQESRSELTTAPNLTICRWAPINSDFTITIVTKISGLWKDLNSSTSSISNTPMIIPENFGEQASSTVIM